MTSVAHKMVLREKVNDSYAQAKRVLNASAPDRIVCRTKENDELKSYLIDFLENAQPLSLYVNGQPGTGKTLTVTHLLDQLKANYKFKQVVINCMSMKNMQSFYKLLSQELSNTTSKKSGLDSSLNLTPSKRGASSKEGAAKAIEKLITSTKQPIVLVLDEIDQIETSIKSSADLYRIFDWPFIDDSKLCLIGIANALDFTDRLLPRLELKPECKPKIIRFLPYTKEDIMNIVKDRLNSIKETTNSSCIIEDKAILFCASKIASTSGDIRKVLDICRRAVEMIEKDTAKLNNQVADPSDEGNENMQTTKPVGIPHIMRILNEINPMTNSNLDRSTMPLMQKILLCTILLCSKEMKIKDVPLSKLFDKFNRICKKYSTEMDNESEFINLCTLVQDNGLVELIKSKEKQAIRTYRVILKIDEQELKDRLQDEAFMADILTNKLYK